MRKAVILAAGRGTRMGHLTDELPKPMLPVAGKPLLEHVLDGLREAGFTAALIVTGYRAEAIESYFAGYPMEMVFVRQEVANGTAKATMLARDWVGAEPFLLTFGDILMATEDYRGMAAAMEGDTDVVAVAAVKWVDDPAPGAAVYERDRVIYRIIEKPPVGTSSTNWNSAGGYTFRALVFEELERVPLSPRGEYEITSAVEQMIAQGRKLLIHPLAGAWRDVGRPEDLAAAEKMLREEG